MKQVMIIWLFCLLVIFSIFVFINIYSYTLDIDNIRELKADYGMLYSEIEQLKSRIESMESIE